MRSVIFKAWLHTVSKNHCLMLLRSAKSKRHEPFEMNENSVAVVEMNLLLHPDDSGEKETKLRLLEDGIRNLNDDQKKCIELFYLEEKSYQQVSELTGYSMLQVKVLSRTGKET